MATKWKNRLYILVTILLFTFGVSGILSSISLSSKYLEFNYAETSEFNEYLNEFTNLLGLFELNYSSQAEMKAKITVARRKLMNIGTVTVICRNKLSQLRVSMRKRF